MVHRGSVSTYLRFMLEIMLTPSPYTSNPLSSSSKNWMPLYNTVLIYKATYMKKSWYWVTHVPLKWSRQSALYGIQYWKVQIWKKFPLSGTTGIYFFTPSPHKLPCFKLLPWTPQAHQKKALQTRAWLRKVVPEIAHISLLHSCHWQGMESIKSNHEGKQQNVLRYVTFLVCILSYWQVIFGIFVLELKSWYNPRACWIESLPIWH